MVAEIQQPPLGGGGVAARVHGTCSNVTRLRFYYFLPSTKIEWASSHVPRSKKSPNVLVVGLGRREKSADRRVWALK